MRERVCLKMSVCDDWHNSNEKYERQRREGVTKVNVREVGGSVNFVVQEK